MLSDQVKSLENDVKKYKWLYEQTSTDYVKLFKKKEKILDRAIDILADEVKCNEAFGTILKKNCKDCKAKEKTRKKCWREYFNGL